MISGGVSHVPKAFLLHRLIHRSNVGHMSSSSEHIPEWTAGDRFRKAREDAGLSQQELADAIGVDRNTVSAYELDHRKRPMKMVVNAWALRCAVPVSWLINGSASTRWRSPSSRDRRRFLTA